jgi:hypothetical protein
VNADFRDEIRRALAEADSIEEAQARVNSITLRLNNSPVEEFHGLSPQQMTRILSYPFDSTNLVEFPAVLSRQPEAPVITLFNALVDAVGEKGLKPTVTGNLPVKVVQAIAQSIMTEHEYHEFTRFGQIRSEVDYAEFG